MAGCIVQVWFEPDFATFCALVDGDRLIGGAILGTRKDAHGARVITDRQPCAFRRSAVQRCQLPRWRFVEGVDDSAAP